MDKKLENKRKEIEKELEIRKGERNMRWGIKREGVLLGLLDEVFEEIRKERNK